MTVWPSRGRLALVVLLLLVTAGVAGVSYVRIADVHAEPDWRSIDTDRPATQVLADVREQLRRVDHRTVTRVTRLDGDGADGPDLRLEDVYDYSNGQYVANYRRLEATVEATWAQHHSLLAQVSRTYLEADDDRIVVYADDRSQAVVVGHADGGAPRPTATPADHRIVQRREIGSLELAARYPFFLPFDADWRVVDRTEATVTYGIDDPGEYLAVRRLWAARAVHEGTRIRLTLDRETGRPRSVTERRVLTHEVDTEDGREVERRRRFRLETRFEAVGDVDVRRPGWAPAPSLEGLIQDYLKY